MTASTPPNQHPPGKSIGQGMLIAGFSLGLIGLTFLFDGWLDKQANPNQDPVSSETGSGIREVVLQRNRQGHYVSGGEINGLPVTFLLDTGATDVAIPTAIANKAGLNRGLASQASTANGVITVYSTQINELIFGNITLNNINASITPSMSGDTILLGMSALNRIEFSQQGSTLTLRQTPES
jgi:aspartyl protease family protein